MNNEELQLEIVIIEKAISAHDKIMQAYARLHFKIDQMIEEKNKKIKKAG